MPCLLNKDLYFDTADNKSVNDSKYPAYILEDSNKFKIIFEVIRKSLQIIWGPQDFERKTDCFLQEFKPIQNWTLIPTKIKNKEYMAPIKDSQSIFSIKLLSGKRASIINDIISQTNISVLDTSRFSSANEIFDSIVIKLDRNEGLLKLLYYCKDKYQKIFKKTHLEICQILNECLGKKILSAKIDHIIWL